MLDMTGLEAAAASGPAALRARLLPPDTALESLPRVCLNAEAGDRFRAGQEIAAELPDADGLVRVYGAGEEFMGVGLLSADGRLAPKRVFRAGEKNP